ncbi:MAG: UDP-N-acetylmuramoyl-L-alanyl-D-glutamate--2,6-diaminopimelate ligase [Clostridiaceae bacterium]|jgi:UDP-N-acetylmuramoyl-L-alanyl-D-glutamate--2,6-diaminopimelate ligase|nr:UDP-N-acetylmuramoyl-L-alanyl-D-glutamate--2,6-diaminopimelate ligase [Clostridiaceae bacterium]
MTHTLRSLIGDLNYRLIAGNPDTEVSQISYDSRQASPSGVFVCIHGHIVDAHSYIPEVISKGVSAVVINNDENLYDRDQILEMSKESDVTFIGVDDTRIALAKMSIAFYDHPASSLQMIGITGTKGKTTTTYMIYNIFAEAGKKTGLIGTIANIIGGEIKQAKRTTPEAVDLQLILKEMADTGSDSCVMEVSSLGLAFGRVYGIDFQVSAFTNLYPDHISAAEHADMKEYLEAKLLIFKQSKNALVNLDCSVGREVVDFARDHCPVYTYGLSEECDCRAVSEIHIVRDGINGTEIELRSPWYNGTVFIGLPGRFNIYNALCAIAISGLSGIPFEEVRRALAKVAVPGRLQNVPNHMGITALVDYAHNAASLEILLDTLREYCTGRLITVFGCGGNRSGTRRTEMGRVAGRLSDLTFVTSDNPRDEEPMEIINAILEGIIPTGGKFIVEPDRKTAIEKAIMEAAPGDFVIIAGKGHENYQIFKDQVIHFDDAETAAEVFSRITDKRDRG